MGLEKKYWQSLFFLYISKNFKYKNFEFFFQRLEYWKILKTRLLLFVLVAKRVIEWEENFEN